MSIVIIVILNCGVVAHLARDVVGSIGVVDVDLWLPPEISPLLVLDQADDKEDQKYKEKNS